MASAAVQHLSDLEGKARQGKRLLQELHLLVKDAVPLANVYTGPQEDFFVMDPQDLNRVDREALGRGLEVLGVYHSHPNCDAYFSKRDLENSCSWFSYVVLSIKSGRFDHAASYRPDFDQKEAPKEELIYG